MKRQIVNRALCLSVCSLWSVTLFAQSDPAPDPAREVDIVRALGERFRSLQHFKVEVVDTIDDVLENGRKVQYSHRRTALVSRPDKLVLQSRGDLRNRKLVKDGRTVTLMDMDHKVYAQVAFEGTIDQMMDALLDRYGIGTPLADFLGRDPSAGLLEGTYDSLYLGLHHVGEHECHHLAFRRDDLDWQAWVGAGETPHMWKLVITYKNEAGAPQYTVHLKSFESLEETIPDGDAFTPTIPADFEQIDILPLNANETMPTVKGAGS